MRVDDRLAIAANEALATRALALLQAKLAEIKTVVAADRLSKLQKVVIVMDLTHGALTSMQYHPSAGWLRDNGYAEDLEKCVHLPVVSGFADPWHNHVQPWCVLHELAHAYHDQVLGFANPRIKEVWDRYVASGHGDRTLKVDGVRVRHYALTNAKEFFAEMTEAYFGTNDFYPFVHGELKEAEPETYALLREIWGPVAGR